MVFSSSIFLFLFLPITLIGHLALPFRFKNLFLLLASVFFYSWGEQFYALVMLISIFVNYCFGRWIDKRITENHGMYSPFVVLSLGISSNLTLLFFFKYSNFLIANINEFLEIFSLPLIINHPIHLPIGISFFTFQAMSYLVDVYRKTAISQTSFVNCALYISLFPQMIAGPIVRYSHIAEQLRYRVTSIDMFSSGIQRFVFGLSKKMLLANPLGEIADTMFQLGPNELGSLAAWIGIIAYSLQIYYDFSGYSDMAIGLGRMFGFDFLENFNYPYISRSIKEFWSRWHISLSTWFRDYLYIPLGGNRVNPIRTYVNLWIVFILCGLWHGASWNFLIWGCLHGTFLIIERCGFHRIIEKSWQPFQHLYTIVLVAIAWVFFRAETLSSALLYIKALFGMGAYEGALFPRQWSNFNSFIFISSILVSTPVFSKSLNLLNLRFSDKFHRGKIVFSLFSASYFLLIVVLFLLSISFIASGTYNPFIYFRF